MSLSLYLALGALAVAVIFGLSTDVRAAVRRLFSSPPSVAREPSPRRALRTLGKPLASEGSRASCRRPAQRDDVGNVQDGPAGALPAAMAIAANPSPAILRRRGTCRGSRGQSTPSASLWATRSMLACLLACLLDHLSVAQASADGPPSRPSGHRPEQRPPGRCGQAPSASLPPVSRAARASPFALAMAAISPAPRFPPYPYPQGREFVDPGRSYRPVGSPKRPRDDRKRDSEPGRVV